MKGIVYTTGALYNTYVLILHRMIQSSFIDMESMFKLFTEEEEVILKLVINDQLFGVYGRFSIGKACPLLHSSVLCDRQPISDRELPIRK